MSSSHPEAASAVRCLLPRSLEAANQIPDAHVLFVRAPVIRAADKIRSFSLLYAISKGNSLSTLVAFGGGASFGVPVLFTAEQDQALPTSAFENSTAGQRTYRSGSKFDCIESPLSRYHLGDRHS